jgi:hypothetical protein
VTTVETPLSLALRRHGELGEQWAARFDASTLRLHRTASGASLRGLAAPLIEALTIATDAGIAAALPGSASVRELEKTCGFVGARLATDGATGFEVAAVVFSLRDVAVALAAESEKPALHRLFEWLAVISLDAFADARVRAARERSLDQLESGTPVVMLTTDIPAVFLVGDPGAAALGAILGRTALTVVGSSARTLIVDVSGLHDLRAPWVSDCIDHFFAERFVQTQIAAVGLTGEARERWQAFATRRGVDLAIFDSFDVALAHAMERSGRSVISRR